MYENPTYEEFMIELDKIMYFYDRNKSKTETKDMYNSFIFHFNNGKKYADKIIGSDVVNEFYTKKEYEDLISDSINMYISHAYPDYKIKTKGCTLKQNLIGKAVSLACCSDVLGVIRGFDVNPRFLIVDFIDDAEVKIDIDELYIPSQIKK